MNAPWKITQAYHTQKLENYSFLVTGGAGFIGSNIVQYLLDFGAKKVRVLDDLSNGKIENITPFKSHPAFEFIEGTIADYGTCEKACDGIDYLSHQAALGSVPRSIKNPKATQLANETGFLNMITAAKNSQIKQMVFASSSSVYGDDPHLPKKEEQVGNPLSPYAVGKKSNEIYADVFKKVYDFNSIGLRYFNIFGPNQSPDGPYAAVIPLYMDALLKNQSAKIFGDGTQSRDFTFVENAVQANIKALFCEEDAAFGTVFNIACGDKTSVNELYHIIKESAAATAEADYCPPRTGDIKDSLADISRAKKLLNYAPQIDIKEGLSITLEWFRNSSYFKV